MRVSQQTPNNRVLDLAGGLRMVKRGGNLGGLAGGDRAGAGCAVRWVVMSGASGWAALANGAECLYLQGVSAACAGLLNIRAGLRGGLAAWRCGSGPGGEGVEFRAGPECYDTFWGQENFHIEP
jgi:hypothetical protein